MRHAPMMICGNAAFGVSMACQLRALYVRIMLAQRAGPALRRKYVTWRPIATYHLTTARWKGGGHMPTGRALPMFERREIRQQSFTTQGYRITPVARRTRIAWLGGSFVWERPAAVEVGHDGYARRLPIGDVTRLATVAVLAAGVVFRTLGARRGRANTNKGKGSSRL